MRISDWSSDVCSSDLAAQGLGRVEKRRAATGDDAFFNGRAGRVQRVVDAVLALLDFDFRCAANLDDGHAASQLGQTLLQLFAVVVGRGRLDLSADLLGAALDRFSVTGAIDDGGVVLVDGDALGGAEHAQGDVFELDAEVFGNDFALGQAGDVFQHGLAAVAEARRLYRRDLQVHGGVSWRDEGCSTC